MKIERRENGITLVPESKFERESLQELKYNSIKSMNWEDSWESKGKFLIDFDTEWDK